MQVLDSILLVDDDKAANFFHRSLIQKLGISKEIYETGNGKEAFDHIEKNYRSQRQLPSLVLIDLAMPGMNGIELIEELKASELLSVNKIPLAVLTSSHNEKDKEDVRKLGDFSYITKPLNEAKLFTILEKEVAPVLFSQEKRFYINEMNMVLSQRLDFLRQQNLELRIKLEEIKKYRSEVTERMKKFREKL